MKSECCEEVEQITDRKRPLRSFVDVLGTKSLHNVA